MAFLLILLVVTLIIVGAPWLGTDSRDLERRPDQLPDWPGHPSTTRRNLLRRIR